MKDEAETQTRLIDESISVLKGTQEALRKEHAFTQSIIDATQMIILTLDTDGKIVFFNKYMEELFGYKLAEVKGKDWFTTFLPECDYDKIRALFKQAVGDTQTRGNVNTVKTKNGELRDIEWYDRPLKNSSGDVIGLLATGMDVTGRKEAQRCHELGISILRLLNKPGEEVDTIRGLLALIKNATGFEAVGIRLQNGDDYPYYETEGFPDDFVEKERYLCVRDQDGKLICDSDDKPILECMCGNIISVRTDPLLPFFTKGGSFWTNSTTKLLDSATTEDLHAHTRNYCNARGYESVALIPLSDGTETIGLLQFNDSRKGMFTLEQIEFFEGIGTAIGTALARKKAEKELRLFRELIDQSNDAVFVIDPETGVFSAVNHRSCVTMGYTCEELLSMGVIDIEAIIPDSFSWKAHVKEVRKKGSMLLDGMHKRKDGSTFPVEVNIRYVSCKEQDYIVANVRDITERKKIEENLKRQKMLYEGLVETSQNLIFKCDIEGKFTFLNKAWEALMGYRHDEMIGRPFSEFKKPEVVVRDLRIFQRILAGESIRNYETSYLTKEREEKFLVFNVQLMHDVSGKIIGIQGTAYDVTELLRAERHEKELQKDLSSAEQMESLGVLASGIAHDLNNVLMPAIILPDVMRPYFEKSADQFDEHRDQILEWTQEIKVAAKRAASVIRDLVTMGRRDRYDMVPLDINQIIRNSMISCKAELLEKARLDVSVIDELSKGELVILGSEHHMVRIIFNLIKNAVEAIDGPGKIVIRTSRQRLDRLQEGYERVPAGDYVLVEISDTGKGIAKKDMGRIFEPFFTSKPQHMKSGSGLGLSILHGLLKDHGGYVVLESTVGKGTTFQLYFPASKEALELKPDTTEIEKDQMRGIERVLIVDDEELVLTATGAALQRFGYDVTTVSSGREAVGLFYTAKKAGEASPFDIVITDMIMEDLDGLGVYEKILKLYPGQKAIISSGYASQEKVLAAKKLGADWLYKPYEQKDLDVAVRNCLDRSDK